MTIFEQYPTLSGLKDLITEEEARAFIDETKFKSYYNAAQKNIRKVKLEEIFPQQIEREEITLRDFMGCWGNVSIEAVCKICMIAKFVRPTQVFEIGTFNGITTLQLAINTPPWTKIHTLDLPDDSLTQFKLNWLDKIVNRKRTLGSRFLNDLTSDKKKIHQILHDSATFDFAPYYGSVELVFIDAGHDYENVKKDTENALKMLSSSGVILWDNYGDILSPEVTLYLGELAEKLPIYHLKGTNLVTYWKH